MPIVAALTELLVPGLQAIGWLYLLSCLVLGWQWLPSAPAELSKDVQVVIIGALAYTLGVVVDRAGDLMLGEMVRRTRKIDKDEFIRWRVAVHGRGGDLSEHLQYVRSRIRITRATFFNLVVTAVVLVALLVFRGEGGPGRELIGYGLVLDLILLIAFWWTWLRLAKTYDDGLTEAYRQLSGGQAE